MKLGEVGKIFEVGENGIMSLNYIAFRVVKQRHREEIEKKNGESPPS